MKHNLKLYIHLVLMQQYKPLRDTSGKAKYAAQGNKSKGSLLQAKKKKKKKKRK